LWPIAGLTNRPPVRDSDPGPPLGLWKDIKTSKTLRWHVFRETGTYSSRDNIIFERLLRIFQRRAGSFAKTIFGFACYLLQVFDQVYYITDALKLIVFACCVNVNTGSYYIMNETQNTTSFLVNWSSGSDVSRKSHPRSYRSHSRRSWLRSSLSWGRSWMMGSLSPSPSRSRWWASDLVRVRGYRCP